MVTVALVTPAWPPLYTNSCRLLALTYANGDGEGVNNSGKREILGGWELIGVKKLSLESSFSMVTGELAARPTPKKVTMLTILILQCCMTPCIYQSCGENDDFA